MLHRKEGAHGRDAQMETDARVSSGRLLEARRQGLKLRAMTDALQLRPP
jgi:hypothetical protein